jgi:hypothetical protein
MKLYRVKHSEVSVLKELKLSADVQPKSASKSKDKGTQDRRYVTE